MKFYLNGAFLILIIALLSAGCNADLGDTVSEVPQDVIDQLTEMGFNPDGIERVPQGYRIERDIIIRHSDLESTSSSKGKTFKQYSTHNLVTTGGSRNITVHMPHLGTGKAKKLNFNSTYVAALDLAISRFNAENIEITFSRIASSNADIVFRKMSKRDERLYLGSAGFPTNGGDPYDEIEMNSQMVSYGYSTGGIATVFAHELGHCIGFRHTDYFDRSLSCGGSPYDEGQANPIGANHIPGTPTGFSADSWMLSCTGGGDRPFNSADQDALDYLY